MKRKILSLIILSVLALLLTLISCKKSSVPINMDTLTIGNIDLNGAASPTNIPVNPTITATFNTDVDATTAKAANISLTEGYDTLDISLGIICSGTTVTITPLSNLANGALYTLKITSGLKATNGETLSSLSRSFTTTGTFLPAGPVAYWNFDGNANDQTGYFNPPADGITDITYVNSRNPAAGQAAQFNGTTSLIEIPDGVRLMNTSDFSISFWMKCDTTAKRDQFVLGVSAWYGFLFEFNSNLFQGTPSQKGQCKMTANYSLSNGGSTSEDLSFDGTGNLGMPGWTFSKDLVSNNGTGVNGLLADQWAQIVCTYDHITKLGTMYINGQMMKQQDFNFYGDPMDLATGLVWGDGTGDAIFVFGFIQDKVYPSVFDSWADYNDPANGHYKGLLDDVAIFHKVLSPPLIRLMYNSGK